MWSKHRAASCFQLVFNMLMQSSSVCRGGGGWLHFLLGKNCSNDCRRIRTKSSILWNSITSTSFVFTELANTMKYGGGGGGYITLFSPSDVTAFHRLKYGGGDVIKPCFHRVTSLRFTDWSMGEGCYITLFSPSDVTAFHRIQTL